jgi:hypothetical protein
MFFLLIRSLSRSFWRTFAGEWKCSVQACLVSSSNVMGLTERKQEVN